MTAPLSLDHIWSLHAGITPGPWRAWKDNDGRRGSAVETAWTHDADGEDMELITDWCSHEDAAFIAAAPSIVAHLLGIVERMQAQVAATEELAEIVVGEDLQAGLRMVARGIRTAITREGGA